MKKLFIPAILAVGMISSAVAMDQQVVVEQLPIQQVEQQAKSEVFYVGKDELKIGEKSLIKFSNLIGYKTKQDAQKQENGVEIGLVTMVPVDLSCGECYSNHYFVKEEYTSQSWWISGAERLTVSQLNCADPFQAERKFKEVNKFVKKFDALSFDLKVEYLNELKIKSTVLMSDCCAYVYNDLTQAVGILDYLIGLKEYSNADKIALFIAQKLISRSYISELESVRYDYKHNDEYEAVNAMFRPSLTGNVCFVKCKKAFISGGDCLNFSNLIGHKTQEDAEQGKKGFVVGVFCECRSGMTGEFFGFVLPEFADQEIWVNVCDRVQTIKKDSSLKLVEDLWIEYNQMDEAKKAEYLDGLAPNVSDFTDQMTYLDMMASDWVKNAIETLKHPSGKASDNVYKIILYCAKVQADALAQAYVSEEV